MKKNTTLLLLLSVFFLASCKKAELTEPEIPKLNYNPTVGNTVEAFGYTATVSDLTISDEYSLKITGSSLNIGLVVSNYSTGTLQVQVINKAGQIIFDRTAISNTVQGYTYIATLGDLDKVKLKYTSFTGVVSLGVTPRN